MTTQFNCQISVPLCPRAKLTFVICKQIIVKRVTKKHSWLCFSCNTNTDTYHLDSKLKKFQVKRISYTEFLEVCQHKHFMNWDDGIYKIFVGGSTWGECGNVKIENGRIVSVKRYQ